MFSLVIVNKMNSTEIEKPGSAYCINLQAEELWVLPTHHQTVRKNFIIPQMTALISVITHCKNGAQESHKVRISTTTIYFTNDVIN